MTAEVSVVRLRALFGNRNGRSRHVLIIVENNTVPFDPRVWREARALKTSKYEVSVICPTHPQARRRREVLEGIAIYRHPLPRGKGLPNYILEYSVALLFEFYLAVTIGMRRPVDVVHACNPPDTIFLVGAFMKTFLGAKFVFDHHDLSPELHEAKFGEWGAIRRILLLLERWTYKLADVALVTNQSYRQIAIKRCGMDPNRVFVIRNGPEIDRFTPVPAVPAWKNGRMYLVGYVGHLSRQKGVHHLVAAAHHVVRRRGRTDIQFVVVGDGPELRHLRAQAEELGIGDHFTFTGFIAQSDPRLLEVLSTADICVCTLDNTKMNNLSTAMKIIEYMALSKPIVQFDLKEARVSAESASLYAEPDNALDFAEKLLQLIEDPTRRAEMGRLGRQRVEAELAWSHQATQLLAAYSLLFGSAAACEPTRGKQCAADELFKL